MINLSFTVNINNSHWTTNIGNSVIHSGCLKEKKRSKKISSGEPAILAYMKGVTNIINSIMYKVSIKTT